MSEPTPAHLPRHVAAVMRSLVPIACPDGGSGLEDPILASTAELVSAAPRHIRVALFAGIVTYDLGAIAHPGVAPKPAHRLSLPDRRRYFLWWWNSPLMMQRELIKALKGFLALSYYEHPRIRERLGYTPDEWIERVRKRRLTLYSDAVATHQQALLAPDPLPAGTFGHGPAPRDAEVSHAS